MNNVYYLRRQANLSLRYVESYTKIHFSNLALIEKGQRSLTQNHIETLCNFFQVSSDFLLGKSDYGIYLELSTGFITINKQDYEIYKYKGLIQEYVFGGKMIRVARKDLEDSIDPLFNQDLKEQINKELNQLSQKQLEKVLKLIKEVIK